MNSDLPQLLPPDTDAVDNFEVKLRKALAAATDDVDAAACELRLEEFLSWKTLPLAERLARVEAAIALNPE